MKIKILIITAWSLFWVAIGCGQGVGNGSRLNLTSELGLASGQFAQLFIPDYYQIPAEGRLTLVFHFHSASWAAEDVVYRSGVNAVLFNIHLGALSSPYQAYFANVTRFSNILERVRSLLQSQFNVTNLQIDKLILTSFSAGYAGVREILTVKTDYEMIDALLLADGLHSSSASHLMQSQLQNFVRFAADARDQQKIMFITHSSIPTSGYRSTTETANYLLHKIGAQRQAVNLKDEIGTCTSVCDTGSFHLRGYTGETAEDHMKHLYNMHQMLKPAVELLEQSAAGVNQSPAKTNSRFCLRNYPNPFNLQTCIYYELPQRVPVALQIFNCSGQLVQTLMQGEQPAGGYQIGWTADDLASGIYFFQLRAGVKTVQSRCLLIR